MSDPQLFREVYGYDTETEVNSRWERNIKTKTGVEIEGSECPFNRFGCWKKAQHGMGVCGGSSSKGDAVITCPKRFETDTVWNDLQEYFFPNSNDNFDVLSEANIGDAGNIDLLAVTHDGDEITDFAAIEIQASYFTGGEIQTKFDEYMASNEARSPRASRGMDYRSCVDKRLLPQLLAKVAGVLAWNEPFAVVLQDIAFENSNVLKKTEEVSKQEADIFWFPYEYIEDSPQYRLERNSDVYTTTLQSLIDAFGKIPSLSRDEFVEKSNRKLSKFVQPEQQYAFLYNRANHDPEFSFLEWYPAKIRLENLSGIGKKTARKLSDDIVVIEDFLSENGELADFVTDVVPSHLHKDLLDEVLEAFEEAQIKRGNNDVKRAREMNDWTVTQ
jgi:hypothetical protein